MFVIDRPGASLQPTHRRAIVSVVIGEEYKAIWSTMSQASWQAYCARHGYDLIIVTEPLDTSGRAAGRSPAWQKLLVLNEPWSALYDRIVWIDADIVISPTAPDIVAASPDPAKVGVCISGDQMSEADKHVYFERLYNMQVDPLQAARAWEIHEANRLAEDGITEAGAPMLNTGVMVLTPALHNDLFLETYALDGKSRLYEQPQLSYQLWKRGLIHRLSARFNWIVQEVLTLQFHEASAVASEKDLVEIVAYMRKELGRCYFLHFAGSMTLLRYMAGLARQSGEAFAPAA
ncbi:hypothetical protein [Phenylobacterium sp.]|jgi:hypothetical protein|uniref:hypothetical protein n=1 Tax=Phenylobacterium sp. TaxID=1871053 RepID=UPI0037840CEA